MIPLAFHHSANPTGVEEQSPGLARLRAYPGEMFADSSNPKGVVQNNRRLSSDSDFEIGCDPSRCPIRDLCW